MPKFSIVVASYLGEYPRCAKYREQKFYRAIDSILNQTFKDYEVIIVADGCDKTMALYEANYRQYAFIKCIQIKKQPIWSCAVRNSGIKNAKGEYITYLDTDDKFGVNHLAKLNAGVTGLDWVWYDDYIMNSDYEPIYNACSLEYGKCGTSNVTHKRLPGFEWKDSTYAHDWKFLQHLMAHGSYAKIPAPEYHICHIPKRIDV